jgi:hypothetical protein
MATLTAVREAVGEEKILAWDPYPRSAESATTSLDEAKEMIWLRKVFRGTIVLKINGKEVNHLTACRQCGVPAVIQHGRRGSGPDYRSHLGRPQ